MTSLNVYRQKTAEILPCEYMDAKDIDVLVGKNLRRLRTRAGLTQDQLGEKIGVDGNVIAQIEGAVRGMGKSMMTRLCNSLKIETWEFHWTEKSPFVRDEQELHDIELRREADRVGIGDRVREAEAIWIEAAKKGQVGETAIDDRMRISHEKIRRKVAAEKPRRKKSA